MSQNEKPDDTLRINFLLERRADPLLFDELCQFKKGSKRAEQLRSLAHDGALARRTSVFASGTLQLNNTQASQVPQGRAVVQETKNRDVLSEAAHDMFGPPI